MAPNKKPKKKNRKLWNRAEKIVMKEKGKKTLKGDDYALVQHIYQNMIHSKKAAFDSLLRIANDLDRLGEHAIADEVDLAIEEGSHDE